MSILVWIEQNDGKAVSNCWELLARAKELAAELGTGATALLIGDDVDGLAQQAFAYGAESGAMIRIGGSFALTGPIPDPGKDIRYGAEIAIDDLNAAGGIEGFMFELVAEDGACDGTQGTNVANKFAADETIVAVTGGTCSGETFGLITP